ncbi:DUF2752 domain-containing protein [Cellulomonas pakistanensis]|uniref:Membrane protein n=1 Tax=Cellulomonas pakistanensis TaxID=992287 RepID=A0A919PAW1_9CELL|nr:DUF2752 domain-containing protein [Cellulomonas pakistanensis]GIG35584.1 membrane protein [Cellulomonas pakistanensis]
MATAAPPETLAPRARLRAAAAPLAVAGGAAVAALGLVLRDPHGSGSWGVCPMYALTGAFCAGCGGLRATHDLLVGDLAGAWAMNPLWVLLVPVLAALWVRWLVRALRTGRRAAAPPAWVAVAAVAVVLLYSVARNVPAWAGALAP